MRRQRKINRLISSILIVIFSIVFLYAGYKVFSIYKVYQENQKLQEEMQDLFYNLGCVYARSFDGGGSSSLIFKGDLINVPKGGSERAVVDFLYFTE